MNETDREIISRWLAGDGAFVRDLIDPDPCHYDHHGYCQTHAWLTEGGCPQAEAKRVLAEIDKEQD